MLNSETNKLMNMAKQKYATYIEVEQAKTYLVQELNHHAE